MSLRKRALQAVGSGMSYEAERVLEVLRERFGVGDDWEWSGEEEAANGILTGGIFFELSAERPGYLHAFTLPEDGSDGVVLGDIGNLYELGLMMQRLGIA